MLLNTIFRNEYGYSHFSLHIWPINFIWVDNGYIYGSSRYTNRSGQGFWKQTGLT